MSTIKKWYQAISEKPNMEFQPGASEGEISSFEGSRGISLPDGYKQWLALSDGGELFIPGVQLYGVAHNPLIITDDGGLPKGTVVIGAFCFGDPVCYITGEDTIRSWNHETGEYDEQWDSFMDFLIDIAVSFDAGDET